MSAITRYHRAAYCFAAFFVAIFVLRSAFGQNAPQAWRPPSGTAVAPIRATAPKQAKPAQTTARAPQRSAHAQLQQVSASSAAGKPINRLPNNHKQVWREYDISPYTTRVDSNGAPPQQAIVDWILRDMRVGIRMWSPF